MFRCPIRDGLELRLYEDHRAPVLAEVVRANLTHLSPWMPWATPEYNEQQALTFIRSSREQWFKGDGFSSGIWEHGTYVGGIGTHEINHTMRSVSIGYWLAESAQGRGIMTACARALVDYCFRDLDLHRVWLEAAVENTKSRAVAERIGMIEEGTLRETHLVHGQWLSMVRYSILRSEWDALQAKA